MEKEVEIMQMIKTHKEITASELATTLQINFYSMKAFLAEAVKVGKLKREERGAFVYFQINPNFKKK